MTPNCLDLAEHRKMAAGKITLTFIYVTGFTFINNNFCIQSIYSWDTLANTPNRPSYVNRCDDVM